MKLNVLWDGGSTLSFITFQKAGELKLKGRTVKLGIIAVGGSSSQIDSRLYDLRLIDKGGKEHTIEVYGMERISSPIEPVNSNEIARLLTMPEKEIARPQNGEIDILIGMQYAALHPVRTKSIGNLLLMENQFGNVVAGSHPLIKESASMTPACMQARTALVMHATKAPEVFFEIEGLGVTCEPKCGGCKCGTCQLGGKNMSLKEEKEYQLIEQGLSFNEHCGRWLANYPWTRSPQELPDNRYVVLAILRSLERRLSRDPALASLYNQQIHDMERR